MLRPLNIITDSLITSVGPLRVAQPLPVHALRSADPFLLLHHAGPQNVVAGGEGRRIEPHPHRGFEPVTFVYRGSVLHHDSLGNHGVIGAGEVQWITSGSGIVHSEGPSEQLQRDGGELELVQLWINLPAAKKMMPPAYQEFHADRIPNVSLLGGSLQLQVVAGEYGGVIGPAVSQTPLVTAMGSFEAGGSGEIPATDMATFVIYVLNGSIRINHEHVVSRHRMAAFEAVGSHVHIETLEAGSLLLLAGEPINEKVAMYGPFVMNTDEELREAVLDYQRGAMGVLNQ